MEIWFFHTLDIKHELYGLHVPAWFPWKNVFDSIYEVTRASRDEFVVGGFGGIEYARLYGSALVEWYRVWLETQKDVLPSGRYQ